MHYGCRREIIVAGDFEQQEVRDVIMGKFLFAISAQQFDKIIAMDSRLIDFLRLFWEVWKQGFPKYIDHLASRHMHN